MSTQANPFPTDHLFYPFYNALVNFKQSYVQPPSLYYVTRDDVLQLTVATPNAAATVLLSLRFMSAQGEVLPAFQTYAVTATAGTPKVILFPNAEGYLLSATVFTPGAPRGQCFVSLAIKRGGGTGDLTTGDLLLQGYPGAVGGISYPQTPIWSALDGRGLMRSIPVTSPAAGADWSLTVPPGVNWILRAVSGKLTTAVTVAARQVSLIVTDATPHLLLESPGGSTEAASLADSYSWFDGAAAVVEGAVVVGGLPAEFRCLAGWIIGSDTANIEAADQWSNIVVTVEEFIGG